MRSDWLIRLTKYFASKLKQLKARVLNKMPTENSQINLSSGNPPLERNDPLILAKY